MSLLPPRSASCRSVRGAFRSAVALVVALAAVAAACRPAESEPPGANTTDPQWVHRNDPHADVAVVFVHGIFGDTVGTWTADRRPSMFDLLHDNPAVGPKVDMFAFGYTLNMFAAGSLSIQEAANSLHGRLQLERILDFPAVVFVAHSMGGLVVLRELLTHREDLLPRVRGLVFYATPQEGIADHPDRPPRRQQSGHRRCCPATRTCRCSSSKRVEGPAGPAAGPLSYEKRPTRDVMVVQVMSATRFCDGTPVAIDADHLQIVKPDRPARDSVMVLVNALNEFALGAEFRAVLDTPDFVPERDYVVFTMTDPFGQSVARLNNTGGSALRYTIGPPSDGKLFVWPDDTEDPAGRRTRAAAVRPWLRGDGHRVHPDPHLGCRRPSVVVVRVPDLAAMMAQQVRLAEDVSRDLGALLASPSTGATFTAAAADDACPEAVTRAARDSVVRHTADLPRRGLGRDRRSHGRGQLAPPGDPRLAARRTASPPRLGPRACSSWPARWRRGRVRRGSSPRRRPSFPGTGCGAAAAADRYPRGRSGWGTGAADAERAGAQGARTESAGRPATVTRRCHRRTPNLQRGGGDPASPSITRAPGGRGHTGRPRQGCASCPRAASRPARSSFRRSSPSRSRPVRTGYRRRTTSSVMSSNCGAPPANASMAAKTRSTTRRPDCAAGSRAATSSSRSSPNSSPASSCASVTPSE